MEGSFGTQIKEILKNRNITIKALAEMIESETGMKMSRQNLNQRLSRDNFQEQDMQMIAKVLGCTLTISVRENGEAPVSETNYVDKTETEVISKPQKENTFEARNDTVRKAMESVRERRIPAFAEAKSEALRSGSILGSGTTGAGTRSVLDTIYARMTDEEREAARKARDERLRLARLHREEEQKRLEEKSESEKARIKEIARRAVEASRNTSGSFIKEERPAAAYAAPESSPIKEFIKKESEPNKNIVIEEKTAELDDSDQEIPVQELMEQEIEEAQSSVQELNDENIETEEIESDKEFSETLVEAARKSTEAAAATRNTADMGVVPDVFRRVGKDELNEPEINPRTGEEFESNVVRSHPRLKGYIQVYDRGEHKWIDMTEWAFLGFQERKKVMLGADYKPPIYLD